MFIAFLFNFKCTTIAFKLVIRAISKIVELVDAILNLNSVMVFIFYV
jgi:hypothetical protein